MCDLGHHDHSDHFGFLVDTPAIRALIDETRRLTAAIPDVAARSDKRLAQGQPRALYDLVKEQDRQGALGIVQGEHALGRLEHAHEADEKEEQA